MTSWLFCLFLFASEGEAALQFQDASHVNKRLQILPPVSLNNKTSPLHLSAASLSVSSLKGLSQQLIRKVIIKAQQHFELFKNLKRRKMQTLGVITSILWSNNNNKWED